MRVAGACLWALGLTIGLPACAAAEHRAEQPGNELVQSARTEPVRTEPVPTQNEGRSDASEPDGRPTRAGVEKVGHVALGSFALAGRVAWAGMTAVGGATVGFVRDGADGARRAWQQGTSATRGVARTEADHVRELSRDSSPPASPSVN